MNLQYVVNAGRMRFCKHWALKAMAWHQECLELSDGVALLEANHIRVRHF